MILGDYKTPKFDPKRPTVALTFDDGPTTHTTPILDTLQQCGGRVSFFVQGNKIKENRGKILRAFNMECDIICHGWDHSDLTKLRKRAIKKQLVDTITEIARITGTASLMFRPPYGFINQNVVKVAQYLGIAIVNWSLDTCDWEVKDANIVHALIMSKVKDGDIILCHDDYESTATAMTRVIPELIASGYQLITVTEMLNHKYGSINPGTIYYDVREEDEKWEPLTKKELPLDEFF